MIGAQPISFLNTGLPVMLMALAAWLVPAWLSGETRSQRQLTKSVIVAAGLVLALGAILFAAIYQLAGAHVVGAFMSDPALTAGFFLRLSLLGGTVWGPVMALAWYVLAQGVERRKGERQARKGRS